MEWSLQSTTKNYEFLLRMQEETGERIATIDEAPELWDHLVWIFRAFMMLSRTRGVTQAGFSAIAYREILAYSQLEGLDGEDLEELVFFLPRMDDKFLEVKNGELNKKQEEQRKRIKRRSNG